ncbi:MAG: orotidine-5'-phosphate decarboxylase [Chloroflexi bacterium]|nr:orotidine-5'-phosphate decarboxylase [Chloroflexota bacterium]
MKSFFDRLEERARQIDSLLCVGLDPHPADLTAYTPAAMRSFCQRMIEATHDLALAYKPNAAFFEAMGARGWDALLEVIAAVPEDIPVVLDFKRGDISSTADAYARSAFDVLSAHAVTINPYLGYDSLAPFVQDPAHGAFLLCKTSNPGSIDLQDLLLAGPDQPARLYEKVATLAQQWNTHNNLGLVVGATHPAALKRVRDAAPDLWFLTPGVGAQGGDLVAALQAGLRRDGMGMLIPVSRGLSRDESPRQAAQKLVESIREGQRQFLAAPPAGPATTPLVPAALAEGLLRAGCVRFGEFTLKSGIQSPIYLDLRQLVSFPEILAEVGAAYIPLLKKLQFDRLAALPYAALPIATSISLKSGWPMLYPRKESKAYGTRAEIEGNFRAGERAVVIDDLATTGGSKFEAIDKLTQAGLVVEDVVVLIDRQSGAAGALAAAGYRLHAVLTLTSLLDYWENTERIPREQIARVHSFLENQ